MALRTALITGITGQDGSDLAELLPKKGYVVHDNKGQASSFNRAQIDLRRENPQQHDLHLKGFKVVDSMENPPTNPAAAGAGLRAGGVA